MLDDGPLDPSCSFQIASGLSHCGSYSWKVQEFLLSFLLCSHSFLFAASLLSLLHISTQELLSQSSIMPLFSRESLPPFNEGEFDIAEFLRNLTPPPAQQELDAALATTTPGSTINNESSMYTHPLLSCFTCSYTHTLLCLLCYSYSSCSCWRYYTARRSSSTLNL